jgi:hypothetical protein
MHFGSVDHGYKEIRTDVDPTSTGLLRVPSKRTALSSYKRVDRIVRRVIFRPVYQIKE